MSALRLGYKRVPLDTISLDVHPAAARAYETWKRAADPLILPDTLLTPEAQDIVLGTSPLPVVEDKAQGAYLVLGSFHAYTLVKGLAQEYVTLAVLYALDGKARTTPDDDTLALLSEAALIVDSCARPDAADLLASVYTSAKSAPWKPLTLHNVSRLKLAELTGLSPERLRRRADRPKPDFKDRLDE